MNSPTKTFRDLPKGSLFRFKDGTEIMFKFDDTTCGFQFAQDGLYPVKPDAEVVELERRDYTLFG